MIEHIYNKNQLLSLIVRTQFQKNGITFLTPHNLSQQLAYMKRPKAYVIQPHIHNVAHRDVFYTQEVLFIKSGKVRVDFYDSEKVYVESRILNEGDVILLVSGGHGFEMLEKTEIIEVKQGPYLGNSDKISFTPVDDRELKVIEE